jgi:hypothetical protein
VGVDLLDQANQAGAVGIHGRIGKNRPTTALEANMQWSYQTRVGTFFIRLIDGRYHIIFRDRGYGSYHSPEAAVDDLAGGHTYSLPDEIVSSELGISRDLSAWTRSSAK